MFYFLSEGFSRANSVHLKIIMNISLALDRSGAYIVGNNLNVSAVL